MLMGTQEFLTTNKYMTVIYRMNEIMLVVNMTHSKVRYTYY